MISTLTNKTTNAKVSPQVVKNTSELKKEDLISEITYNISFPENYVYNFNCAIQPSVRGQYRCIIVYWGQTKLIYSKDADTDLRIPRVHTFSRSNILMHPLLLKWDP